MKYQGTLLLWRGEIADLLTIEEYIEAVERGFQLYGEGKTRIASGCHHSSDRI